MNVTTLREYQMQESQIHTTLERVKRFAVGFQRGRDELQLQVRANMLDDALRQFYVVRRKIGVLSNVAGVATTQEEKEQLDQHNEALRKFEDEYCEVKGILQQLMPQPIAADIPAKVAPGAAPAATCRVKLPEIKLPTFCGKLESWITFRDTFRSLIHNNPNLQTIDKFTYLRASLTGEALQEIGAVEITGANYEVAWNLLEKRYENKRLILKTHLDAIYAVEAMRKESFESLNYVLSAFEKNLQMVDKLGVKSSDWSILLAHTLMSKLDATTLRHWETHYNSREFVKYDVLVEFLRDHCAVLRTILPMMKAKSPEREHPQPRHSSSYAVSVESHDCYFCEGSQHNNVFQCSVFRNMSADERLLAAKKHRLCYNCLKVGHSGEACTRSFCTLCDRKHHTLLHECFMSPAMQSATAAVTVPNASARPRPANQQHSQPQLSQSQNTIAQITQQNTLTSAQDTQQPTTANTSTCNHSSSTALGLADCSREVLLSTAVVRIRDAHGHMLFARALLDSGSQRNLMTKEFAQRLKCNMVPDLHKVKGVGSSESTSTTAVTATVFPRLSMMSHFAEPMKFHVLAKVTSNLPFNRVDFKKLGISEDLQLADPQFFYPGSIDLLIGAEFYCDLLSGRCIKLGDNLPTIQSTVFGWIVTGVVEDNLASRCLQSSEEESVAICPKAAETNMNTSSAQCNPLSPRSVDGVIVVGGRRRNDTVNGRRQHTRNRPLKLQRAAQSRSPTWQKAQNFVQQTWETWSTQYRTRRTRQRRVNNQHLQMRQRSNVRVGTMVLLKEENLSPLRWALGRVVRVIYGDDGNVRVAVVQTKESIYERGISTICVLPICDNQPTSEDEN